jgi:Transposase
MELHHQAEAAVKIAAVIVRRRLSHTLSHPLSHTLSHPLSHVTYPSSSPDGPAVLPARDGHRRRFSDADKRWILEEAAQPDANLAKIARRYGIARRVLCRWKQDLTPPVFVDVQITDANPSEATAVHAEERAL